MVEPKPYPSVDQILKLELNLCESCGAWYSDLLEKPASSGEYVQGGNFEIKSLIRGNVVLGREDVCHSCLMLAKTAIMLRPSLHSQGLSDFRDLIVCFDLVKKSEGVVNTTVSWYRGGGSNLFFRKVITISELSDTSLLASISTAKESRSSAKSKQNLGFIKKMLNLCETGLECHCNCGPGGDGILPARLVSIGDEHGPIRLYETGENEQGSYAALSHCWGPLEKRPIRTLRGNIESMKSEILWDSLSAVFKDSIWLCRQLGIKYIWIDSLCIVQDDGSDWEAEATKMAQYYSEARVTIAVESSPDGSASFLSQRDERWQPQTSSSAPYLISREHYDRQLQEAHPTFYYPTGHRYLPTRAWEMQESILSTRVIHFTPSDVTWECDGETLSEDGFRGWDKVTTHEPSRPFFDIADTSKNDGE
ncbi:HET domain-containing protein [Fusarium sp. LHS14.1]|nr:HET domain-containing protein [Fusarium sp. LHS14.1]